MKNSSNLLRRLTLSTAFVLTTLGSTAALAGEIRVGATPIEVDDKGKITSKGKSAVVDTLDEVPGEDRWVAHIFARLENPAPGPLYIEFYQELDGEKTMVWRHDINDFQGDKWINEEVELEGGRGFNKNRTYDIKVTQVSPKGKDLVLAQGTKIKLIKSGKKPEKSEEEGEEDKALADQDAHDSLGGGGDGEGDGPAAGGGADQEGPPPVETKKKGCAVDSDGSAWNGAMVLVTLGGLTLLRRRRA